jgi:hypothetical protein
MPELERALLELGRAVELPPAPDLAARLGDRLAPRRRRLPRWAVAAVVAALAVGIAFAVPQARSAILRVLHLGGATVVRVETLPPAEERALDAYLGRLSSASAAAQALGGRALLPPGARRVYVAGGIVSVPLEGNVLLSELSGRDPSILKKYAAGSASVEGATVDGAQGLWIESRHVVAFPRVPPRYAGNVLLWQRDGLTLRLEGPDLTLSAARKIAHDLVQITR